MMYGTEFKTFGSGSLLFFHIPFSCCIAFFLIRFFVCLEGGVSFLLGVHEMGDRLSFEIWGGSCISTSIAWGI